TDNCDLNEVVFTQFPDSNTIIAANQPTALVQLIATDASGNSSSYAITVTFEDQTPPVFSSFPSDTVVYAGANCDVEVSWATPTASDNCNALGLPVVTQEEGLASGSLFSL